MVRCLVGLGSNLSDRAARLDAAVESMRRAPRTAVVAHSRWRETTPVGGPPDQPAFMNGAMALETDLSAEALLDVLQTIERAAGRERHQRWGPRTLDLDLLLYGEAVIDTPRLTVPHPRMSFRRFVLDPACEVAPDMRHPVCDLAVAELRAALNRRPRWIAVYCRDSALGESLGRAVAARAGGMILFDDPNDAALWKCLVEIALGADSQASAHLYIWASRHAHLLAAFFRDAPQLPPAPPMLTVLVPAGVPWGEAGALSGAALAVFRGLGPLLRLAPGPLDEMTEEVTAAIAAMD